MKPEGASTDYSGIAALLVNEGHQLLNKYDLIELFSQYGTVYEFGSFALDLMVWPDLDLYCALEDAPLSDEALSDICQKVLKIQNLHSFKIEKNLKEHVPGLPDGIYLQIKIKEGRWKLPWKIDLWFLEKNDVSNRLAWLEKTSAKLTPESRELILETKHRFVTSKGRTPAFSSFYIYEAILDKKLRDPDAIRRYLTEQGISLPDEDFSGQSS